MAPIDRNGINHINKISAIFFNDGWKGRQGIPVNFLHKEYTEIAQKMHVITNELMLNDVKGADAEVFTEIAGKKHNLWKKFFELMAAEGDEGVRFVKREKF